MNFFLGFLVLISSLAKADQVTYIGSPYYKIVKNDVSPSTEPLKVAYNQTLGLTRSIKRFVGDLNAHIEDIANMEFEGKIKAQARLGVQGANIAVELSQVDYSIDRSMSSQKPAGLVEFMRRRLFFDQWLLQYVYKINFSIRDNNEIVSNVQALKAELSDALSHLRLMNDALILLIGEQPTLTHSSHLPIPATLEQVEARFAQEMQKHENTFTWNPDLILLVDE